MSTHAHPVRIDTRLVLRIYAALATTGGALVAAWGVMLLAPQPGESPWFRASLVRVLGALVFASGCSALALAGVDDPESRRRGVGWFAVGHAALALVVAIQADAIPAWNSPWGLIAGTAAATAAVIFAYAWQDGENHDGRTGGFQSLLGSHAALAAQRLRSEYERRIEAAAAQEERHRLARDLHDSVKQQLFAIHTAAATAQERFEGDAGGAREAVEQIRTSAREAMAEMDAMLQGLRAAPLENVGLVGALQQACEALAFRTGARVDFVPGDLPPSASLPPGAHEPVFRVAQEALSNIARHARATHVRVALGTRDGALILTVEDNGAGFDPGTSPRGQGIANMRSRAAECRGFLNIENLDAGGTRLELEIPSTTPTPKEARGYGTNALQWGACAAALWYGAFWRNERDFFLLPALFPVAALSSLICARQCLAFFRSRRSPGRRQ